VSSLAVGVPLDDFGSEPLSIRARPESRILVPAERQSFHHLLGSLKAEFRIRSDVTGRP
jgi:hypothetical protein